MISASNAEGMSNPDTVRGTSIDNHNNLSYQDGGRKMSNTWTEMCGSVVEGDEKSGSIHPASSNSDSKSKTSKKQKTTAKRLGDSERRSARRIHKHNKKQTW